MRSLVKWRDYTATLGFTPFSNISKREKTAAFRASCVSLGCGAKQRFHPERCRRAATRADMQLELAACV